MLAPSRAIHSLPLFKDVVHETLSSRNRRQPLYACRLCIGPGRQRRADRGHRRHGQQVDIDAGNLAKSTSKNDEVKKFAQTMVTDHTGVNKSATDLVTKLKVTPEDNETSHSLKAGGQKNVAALKGLKGTAFDKAYIDHEVAYHQQVLDAIDKTLIPSATNEELKTLLVKVRPAFVAHLEHARQLQGSLGK